MTVARLVLVEGVSAAVAAAAVGVHVETARRWVRAARREGVETLVRGQRGRPKGVGALLSDAQQGRVVKAIEGACPDQYMLEQALWTRQAVADLVERLCGVRPALRTVSTWLRGWGFTSKKPVWRVWAQNEEAVRVFMERDYPALVLRAKAENAEIWFLDEAGVRVDSVRAHGYAKRGERAVATRPPRQKQVNVIQAATRNGRHAFSCYDRTVDSKVVIGFLERLIRRADRKLIVILDNHSSHRGKQTTIWVAEHADKIELVFLPGYAPESNPVEYGHNDVKGTLEHQHQRPATTEALRVEVRRVLQSLSRRRGRVASWFNAKPLTYITHAHATADASA